MGTDVGFISLLIRTSGTNFTSVASTTDQVNICKDKYIRNNVLDCLLVEPPSSATRLKQDSKSERMKSS